VKANNCTSDMKEKTAKPFASPKCRNATRTVSNSPTPIRYNNWTLGSD